MLARVHPLVVAVLVLLGSARARAEGNLPAPFVVDASMALRDFPSANLALLGGAGRLTYRPTSHCLHLFVEGFAGSTVATSGAAIDAFLTTGSVGAIWGAPLKTTFLGVGVGADFGYGRLSVPGFERRGFTSTVGMRAILRSRLRKAFHVHAALMLGGVVRPLTLDFASGAQGFSGVVLGLDLGASFDLARADH